MQKERHKGREIRIRAADYKGRAVLGGRAAKHKDEGPRHGNTFVYGGSGKKRSDGTDH